MNENFESLGSFQMNENFESLGNCQMNENFESLGNCQMNENFESLGIGFIQLQAPATSHGLEFAIEVFF
jgi:hypothetical protein